MKTPGIVMMLSAATLLGGCAPATVSDVDSAEVQGTTGSITMPVGGASAATSAAAPIIADAVGVRLTERALGFVERQVAGKAIAFHKDRIEKPAMKCWDVVGITDFDLSSQVDLADLDWQASPDGLSITTYIDYLDVNGRIFGEDSDTFDLCPSFGVTINSMRLSGIVFTANLLPSADNYDISVDFNAPPQMQVQDIAVDVNNFPGFLEELVLSAEFVQEFLFRKVNEALAEKVPEMTKDALFHAMFTGAAGPFDYAIGASSIDLDAEGANAMFDIQVDYPGVAPACLPPTAMPEFTRRGTPGLGEYGDSSMVELSLADAGVNEVLWAAWKSGFMCFDSELHPLEAFERVLEGISPVAGEMLQYRIVVAEPPRILFEEGKIDAKISQFFLEANAVAPDGTSKVLLRAKADMRVGVKLEVDRATNRMLVSLDSTELEFETIESEILFNEERDVEQHLKDFIKGFVVPRLNAKIQALPVTNTLFAVSDYIILLDGINLREGHAVTGVTMYGKNDPEVDLIAPDTNVTSNPGLVTKTYASVAFDGLDDRAGDLVYSWQIDGAGWSAFSSETVAELSALTQGEHVFEVKSRDRWMNEDASPASVSFTVAAVKEKPAAGCSVDTRSGSSPLAGAVASLFAAIAAGLVARRRSA